MFDDEGASIVAPPLFSSFLLPSNPSSLRPYFDFGLSSSSSEQVDEEIKINDQFKMHLGDETKSTPKPDNTTTANKPGPSEPPVNQEAHQTKSRNSTSNTRSSVGNYVDPFALLELWDNVSITMKKVDAIKTFVVGLNNKIDVKVSGIEVSGLESKLDAILLSLSTATKSEPTNAKREVQLNRLISFSLKHTIEEVEAKYNENLDHYLDTNTTM